MHVSVLEPDNRQSVPRMKAKLNTIISNIILWWSCERVKWDEWNVWNSIFLNSFAMRSSAPSLARTHKHVHIHSFTCYSLADRVQYFAWNLLININVEMVTRIMVFRISLLLFLLYVFFWCVCNFFLLMPFYVCRSFSLIFDYLLSFSLFFLFFSFIFVRLHHTVFVTFPKIILFSYFDISSTRRCCRRHFFSSFFFFFLFLSCV